MTTMTDEEATVLGSRAVNAGLRIVPGMKTLHARGKWSGGIVTGFDYDGKPAISTGLNEPFSPPDLTADLRDPGTKGHAVAQLRERTGNPELSTRCDFGEDESGARWVSWYVGSDEHGGLLTQAPVPCPTEEEAIVAAFEATKETP